MTIALIVNTGQFSLLLASQKELWQKSWTARTLGRRRVDHQIEAEEAGDEHAVLKTGTTTW